jgi:hypothetical protein
MASPIIGMSNGPIHPEHSVMSQFGGFPPTIRLASVWRARSSVIAWVARRWHSIASASRAS